MPLVLVVVLAVAVGLPTWMIASKSVHPPKLPDPSAPYSERGNYPIPARAIPNCKPDEESEQLAREGTETILKQLSTKKGKKKGRKTKGTSIKEFGCRPLADKVSTQMIIVGGGVAATLIANVIWKYTDPWLPEPDDPDVKNNRAPPRHPVTSVPEMGLIVAEYVMIEELSPNVRPPVVHEAPCDEKRIEGSCLEKIKRALKPGTLDRLKEQQASGDEKHMNIQWLLDKDVTIKCICVRGGIVAFQAPPQLRKTSH